MSWRSLSGCALAIGLILPYATGQEPGLPGAEQVEEALKSVFERPEFQPPRPGPLTEAWEWLREKVRSAFSWLAPSKTGSAGEGFLWFLVYALLAVVLTAIILRVSRSLLARRSSPQAKPAAERPPEAQADLPALSAAELAAAGRLLEAAHALYLETLFSLDKRGAARYRPAKTGGEYARELAGTTFEGPFRSLLRAFYPVAFGGRADVRGALDAMRAATAEFGTTR